MNTCSWIMDNEEPCGNICEGRTAFCSSHNRQLRREETENQKSLSKRAALIAKVKVKNQVPRKRVNPVSEKRKELNVEYFKLVEQFKHDNPNCTAKINEYCAGHTDDPHHSRGRGVYLLDVSTWVPVCRSCHIWIGSNHAAAIEKGLIFSRLATIKPTI